MRNVVITTALLAVAAFSQDYKMQVGGAPPEQAGTLKSAVEAKSVKIVDASGKVYCELWLRATPPPAGKSTEGNVTLPEIIPGTFLAVIQFPAQAADRRGQPIKPGFYTVRYANFPITGDHQGVAPQRDFFVLTKLADDADVSQPLKFPDLMTVSRKSSGTGHPLVLSIWKPDTFAPGFAKEGEHDWILQTKVGSLSMAIILIGKGEG